MAKKSEQVTCRTYKLDKVFPDRGSAITFFTECAFNSEGSERDRYMNVLVELYEGKTYCTDGEG